MTEDGPALLSATPDLPCDWVEINGQRVPLVRVLERIGSSVPLMRMPIN